MLKNGTVYPGNTFNLALELADVILGTPIDPATLQLTILDPNGAKTIYNYPADAPGTIVRLDVGSYYAPIVPDKGGRWKYRWVATTPGFADEGDFIVQHSPFVNDSWPVGCDYA